MAKRDPKETQPSKPEPGKCPVCHGHKQIMNEDKGIMESCPWCRGSGKA